KKGVVDKFVEFFGDGLANLPLADRATIANMAPEYGSTCGIFPIDAETVRYLELSGRPRERLELVSAYAKAQGLWRNQGARPARKARERGLKAKPWVKTSLAPGSRVVTDYFAKAGVLDDLAAVGFNLVGYGCTTCIGNSGPLKPEISAAVKAGDLTACAVLSG